MTLEKNAGRARRSSALAAVLALAGCTASAPDPEPVAIRATPLPVAADKAYSGWYIEQSGGEFFQPCGESTRYRVHSAELRSRASAFGLGLDNPVYVRVRGRPAPQDPLLLVSHIEIFGSSTPIRDCPMTGVVIAAPG